MAFSFRHARRQVLAMTLALCAAPAFAQDAWPEKPIRLVVPFPPGGPTDTASRIIGQELSKTLKQTVVVENRAGASGAIAAAAVARSPADGYTFMMLATPTLLAPHLYPSAKYDIQKEFAPVATVYDLPIVVVVNPDVLDVKNMQELIAKAKEAGGTLNYTSSGIGSFGHLTMEMVKQMGGFEMTHVPYGGGAPAITDLLGGQIPIMYADLIAALPHIKAGKLRALAVGSPERVPMLPDVPTIAEQGFPGFSAVSWGGLLAPAGTPKSIVDRVSKDVEDILAQQEVKDRLVGAGAIANYEDPEGMAARIKSDTDKWGALIREKGISAN
jgi:tripartite-type tricarboxylate transporter receptor subunit TctC